MKYQGRGMNLPTKDAISYDLEELADLTVKQLGIQIIARMDLDRPKREAQLDAADYAASVVEATNKFLEVLDGLGAEGLIQPIKAGLNEFTADVIEAVQ